MEATQPEYVLISNGLLYDHPSEKAYKNFKESPRLKRVEKHKVFVAENSKKGHTHETQRAIYSTLTNGWLSFRLNKTGTVDLKTEKEKKDDKKVLVLSSKLKPKDKQKPYALNTNLQGNIQATPIQQNQPQQQKVGTKSKKRKAQKELKKKDANKKQKVNENTEN